MISWEAADDYLESRLTRYIIQVSNVGNTVTYSLTSGIEQKNFTYRLQNLTEYTNYSVSIAAENAIQNSTFTEKVAFLTLCKYQIFLNCVTSSLLLSKFEVLSLSCKVTLKSVLNWKNYRVRKKFFMGCYCIEYPKILKLH